MFPSDGKRFFRNERKKFPGEIGTVGQISVRKKIEKSGKKKRRLT